MNNNHKYSYADAGFNAFLTRSIASTATVRTLQDLRMSSRQPTNLNFDQMQVSGSLGDTITVGNMLLDGATGDGRIDGRDSNGNVVWRLGDIQGS